LAPLPERNQLLIGLSDIKALSAQSQATKRDHGAEPHHAPTSSTIQLAERIQNG